MKLLLFSLSRCTSRPILDRSLQICLVPRSSADGRAWICVLAEGNHDGHCLWREGSFPTASWRGNDQLHVSVPADTSADTLCCIFYGVTSAGSSGRLTSCPRKTRSGFGGRYRRCFVLFIRKFFFLITKYFWDFFFEAQSQSSLTPPNVCLFVTPTKRKPHRRDS